ncbi:MAG: hypothetical protein Q8943_18450, partial [Bacteroidota bacterium]|nr:hypothetical protein [Bacteroidota bacterium]
MHDPKFEKEVQEKMDGLQFNPSDQVWIRLEQELNKEKRRPLPLFWLFVLVGGMLIGAGGTWFFRMASWKALSTMTSTSGTRSFIEARATKISLRRICCSRAGNWWARHCKRANTPPPASAKRVPFSITIPTHLPSQICQR